MENTTENTNKKFMTNEEFRDGQYKYVFVVYSSRADADAQKNPHPVMVWNNNMLDRGSASIILMGMAAGASVKYKNPIAVLYSQDPAGNRKKLDGVCG